MPNSTAVVIAPGYYYAPNGRVWTCDLAASMNRMTFSFERLSLTPALSRWARGNYAPMVSNGGRLQRFMDPMHAKIKRGSAWIFYSQISQIYAD